MDAISTEYIDAVWEVASRFCSLAGFIRNRGFGSYRGTQTHRFESDLLILEGKYNGHVRPTSCFPFNGCLCLNVCSFVDSRGFFDGTGSNGSFVADRNGRCPSSVAMDWWCQGQSKRVTKANETSPYVGKPQTLATKMYVDMYFFKLN